jgi:hypothetical protein
VVTQPNAADYGFANGLPYNRLYPHSTLYGPLPYTMAFRSLNNMMEGFGGDNVGALAAYRLYPMNVVPTVMDQPYRVCDFVMVLDINNFDVTSSSELSTGHDGPVVLVSCPAARQDR